MTISASARVWAERAQAELGAAERFRHLAVRFRSVGAPTNILERVNQAIRDEECHAGWCAAMSIELGHPTGFDCPPGITPSTKHSWQNLDDERDKLLLDVILMCCLTESINASLLASIHAQAASGKPRDLIRRILQDEVKHAQIGWAYLSVASSRYDCHFVTDYFEEMLDSIVRTELLIDLNEQGCDDAYDLGVMPVKDRLLQLSLTLADVIKPGFDHFGINTAPISKWRNDKFGQLYTA